MAGARCCMHAPTSAVQSQRTEQSIDVPFVPSEAGKPTTHLGQFDQVQVDNVAGLHGQLGQGARHVLDRGLEQVNAALVAAAGEHVAFEKLMEPRDDGLA